LLKLFSTPVSSRAPPVGAISLYYCMFERLLFSCDSSCFDCWRKFVFCDCWRIARFIEKARLLEMEIELFIIMEAVRVLNLPPFRE
jgi:hypothetical protein